VDGAAPDPDHRKRPRRRGEALFAAIYQAVVDELAESGYAGLTMERVAERAQTGKASLYRRWPNRFELVIDTAYHFLPQSADVADTGSLRGDLLAMLRAVSASLAGPAGQAMRGLLSEVVRDAGQAAQVRARSRGNSATAMRDVLRRAADRGEADPTAITERQMEAGISMLRFHFLTHGAPIPEETIVGIVDEVMLPLLTHREPRPSLAGSLQVRAPRCDAG
jgi:AcrR family transcriptional regulator